MLSFRMNPRMAEGMVELLRTERYPAIQKSIISAAEALGKSKEEFYQDLQDYAISKRALEVNKRYGEKASSERYTTDKANAYINKAKMDGTKDVYESILDDVYKLNDEALEIRHRYGLISDEQYDILKKASKDEDGNNVYIPFNRIMDTEDDADAKLLAGFDPMFRGKEVKGSNVKRMKGSELSIGDIIENSIANIEDAIGRAKRNDSLKILAEDVRKNPDKYDGIIEIKEIPIVGTSKEGYPRYADTSDKRNEVAFMDYKTTKDGKKKVAKYKMTIPNDNLYMDVMGVLSQGGLLAKTFGMITRPMAMAFTTLNVAFAPRNFIRDIQEVAMNVDRMMGSEAAAKINVARGLHSAATVMRYLMATGGSNRQAIIDKLPKKFQDRMRDVSPEDMRLYQEFISDGGSAQGLGRIAMEDMRGSVNDAYDFFDKIKTKGITSKSVTGLLNALNDWSRTFEDANRFNVYKIAKEKNLAEGMPIDQARKKAGLAARDSSFDPRKTGRFGREMGSLFIFFNAATQSGINAMKSLAKPRVAAKAATLVAGLQAMSFAWNSQFDEDWHDKIDGYARDFGYTFITGQDEDGNLEYLTIPMPYSFKPINTMATHILRKANGYGEEAEGLGGALSKSVLEAFSPLPVNIDSPEDMAFFSPIKPIYEVAVNRDTFGNPIYPDTYKEVFDHVKAWDSMNKSTAGRLLLGITQRAHETFGVDVSPESIEHLWRQYTGSPGKGITSAYRVISDAIVDGKMPTKKDIPIVNAFLRSADREQQEYRVKELQKKHSKYEEDIKRVNSEDFTDKQHIRNYIDDVMEDENTLLHEKIDVINDDISSGVIPSDNINGYIDRYKKEMSHTIADRASRMPDEEAIDYINETIATTGMYDEVDDIIEIYEDNVSGMDAWELSMKKSTGLSNKGKAGMIATQLDRIKDQDARIDKFQFMTERGLITKGVLKELADLNYEL